MIFLKATRFGTSKQTAFEVTHAGRKASVAGTLKPKQANQQTKGHWKIKPVQCPNTIEHEEGEIATPYRDALTQDNQAGALKLDQSLQRLP